MSVAHAARLRNQHVFTLSRDVGEGEVEFFLIKKNPHLSMGAFRMWSGKRDSNSRPQPWQGCALPTELFPHAVYNT